MKSIAVYVLHYGKEYLAWSIRSVQDVVDEVHILYSVNPSFGGKAPCPCPETRRQLWDEAYKFAQKPVFWHDGFWKNEGEHRNQMYKIAEKHKADLILVVDADEIWDPQTAAKSIQQVWDFNTAHATRVHFVNFYRSFNWVCYDPTMPMRIYDLRQPPGPEHPRTWCIGEQEYPVLHFGFAQSLKITDYKLQIHGHRAHLRQDWWFPKFLNWQPGIEDVNPFGNKWNPEPIDSRLKEKVQELLHDHPYLRVPIIT